MKKILSILILAVASLTFSAPDVQAQNYGPVTILSCGTNKVAAATTNSYTRAFEMKTASQLSLSASFVCGDTNLSTSVFTFSQSLDNSTWSTVNDVSFSIACNGTNTVTVNTNYTVGAVGYWRLKSVSNPNTNTTSFITNLTVKASFKP